MSEVEQVAEDNFSLTDALSQDEVVAETEAEAEVEATPEAEESTEETIQEESGEETKTEEDSPTESEKKEPWHMTALLDERDKRQKAVAKAEELQKQLDAKTPAEDDISIFEDEAGFKAQQDAKLATTLRNEKLNMSQALAEDSLGQEVVDEAVIWFKEEAPKSGYLVDRFNNAKLPFHEVVKMFKEDKARRVDPDKLRAELKAEILAEIKADSSKEEPDTSINPSIATKRSGSTNETGEVTLSSILGR